MTVCGDHMGIRCHLAMKCPRCISVASMVGYLEYVNVLQLSLGSVETMTYRDMVYRELTIV